MFPDRTKFPRPKRVFSTNEVVCRFSRPSLRWHWFAISLSMAVMVQ
jgi:hypothetical protein